MKRLLTVASLIFLAACQAASHKIDTFYVHGFLVPVGDNSLSKNQQLTVNLMQEDTLISSQTLNAPYSWPSAYKLEFNPPAIVPGEPVVLKLFSVKPDTNENTLIQSRKIELADPSLFGTSEDLVVMGTPADDSQSLQPVESPQPVKSLFETYVCDDDKDINIYFTDSYAVLEQPRIVLPKVVPTDTVLFRTAGTEIIFTDPSKFNFTDPRGSKSNCVASGQHETIQTIIKLPSTEASAIGDEEKTGETGAGDSEFF